MVQVTGFIQNAKANSIALTFILCLSASLLLTCEVSAQSHEALTDSTDTEDEMWWPDPYAKKMAQYLAAATSPVANPGNLQVKKLYSHKPKWGPYPLMDITSGTRVRLGAGLFYREGYFYSGIEHFRYSRRKQVSNLRITLEGGVEKQSREWQIFLNVTEFRDDDLWFYGIGQEPEKDERSRFSPITTQNRANFYQRKRQLTCLNGFALNEHLELFVTGMLTERLIRDGDDVPAEEWISNVFDTRFLKGYNQDLQQWYTEIAIGINSKKCGSEHLFSFCSEIYVGYQQGIGLNHENLLRTGINVNGRLQLAQKGLYLEPRLLVNQVSNLDNSQPIAFIDYPRHPTFRGIASRYLLRNDEIIAIPSLDLLLPVHNRAHAGLFADWLLATENDAVRHISIRHAPWCVGISSITRYSGAVLGGAQGAYGSEGWRFALWLGLLQDLNDRWRWK